MNSDWWCSSENPLSWPINFDLSNVSVPPILVVWQDSQLHEECPQKISAFQGVDFQQAWTEECMLHIAYSQQRLQLKYHQRAPTLVQGSSFTEKSSSELYVSWKIDCNNTKVIKLWTYFESFGNNEI